VYLLPRFCSELRDFTCDVALVYLLLQERVLAPDSGPFFENKGPDASGPESSEEECVFITAVPITKLFALLLIILQDL